MRQSAEELQLGVERCGLGVDPLMHANIVKQVPQEPDMSPRAHPNPIEQNDRGNRKKPDSDDGCLQQHKDQSRHEEKRDDDIEMKPALVVDQAPAHDPIPPARHQYHVGQAQIQNHPKGIPRIQNIHIPLPTIRDSPPERHRQGAGHHRRDAHHTAHPAQHTRLLHDDVPEAHRRGHKAQGHDRKGGDKKRRDPEIRRRLEADGRVLRLRILDGRGHLRRKAFGAVAIQNAQQLKPPKVCRELDLHGPPARQHDHFPRRARAVAHRDKKRPRIGAPRRQPRAQRNCPRIVPVQRQVLRRDLPRPVARDPAALRRAQHEPGLAVRRDPGSGFGGGEGGDDPAGGLVAEEGVVFEAEGGGEEQRGGEAGGGGGGVDAGEGEGFGEGGGAEESGEGEEEEEAG
mmetsp:Transcript_12894/g.34136  ORF Transcript_12894/g.34136 Transcript_12894/m.34136 type:complete len:400 (-) Transcript_12894:156-1355(-)